MGKYLELISLNNGNEKLILDFNDTKATDVIKLGQNLLMGDTSHTLGDYLVLRCEGREDLCFNKRGYIYTRKDQKEVTDVETYIADNRPVRGRIIEVTAYPYATQHGKFMIPEDVKEEDTEEYIRSHWKDIKFDEPTLDYLGTDFEFYAEEDYNLDKDEEELDR